jgi:prepilin-type N-terminal cleavage/methylation domain-containing protein
MVKKGFTLVEIIVATFILSLLTLGLISVFLSSKRLTHYSRSRVTAGELSKLFLEPLQLEVRQDTWGTPTNKLNASWSSNYTVDKNYNVTYNISYGGVGDTVPYNNLKRVNATIGWNDTNVP